MITLLVVAVVFGSIVFVAIRQRQRTRVRVPADEIIAELRSVSADLLLDARRAAARIDRIADRQQGKESKP